MKLPPCPKRRDRQRTTDAACVYRIFSADNNLLYIGATYSLWRRFAQHQQKSAWWLEADFYTEQWFATRAEANAAEETAIRTEHSRYNRAGVDLPYQPYVNRWELLPPATVLPASNPYPDLSQCLWCDDLIREHTAAELEGCNSCL